MNVVQNTSRQRNMEAKKYLTIPKVSQPDGSRKSVFISSFRPTERFVFPFEREDLVRDGYAYVALHSSLRRDGNAFCKAIGLDGNMKYFLARSAIVLLCIFTFSSGQREWVRREGEWRASRLRMPSREYAK